MILSNKGLQINITNLLDENFIESKSGKQNILLGYLMATSESLNRLLPLQASKIHQWCLTINTRREEITVQCFHTKFVILHMR